MLKDNANLRISIFSCVELVKYEDFVNWMPAVNEVLKQR